MAVPRIETPIGAINGVNRDFEVSTDYRSGSVRVFRNGLLNEGTLTDGWAELGGKRVRLNEAPKTTDIVQVYFIPIS